MTTTNENKIKESVTAFNRLSTDDKLATLALAYTKISSSVPPEAKAEISKAGVGELVNQVEKLSQPEQIDAMRTLLEANKAEQDQIVLDANPAKALTELASGGNSVPVAEYSSLKTESKLAFWYQLGQKLGSGIAAVSSDYQPTPKVAELLDSLSSLETDQQASFLNKVL